MRPAVANFADSSISLLGIACIPSTIRIMRITRKTLHPELRKHYRSLQFAAYMQGSTLGSRFINYLDDRSKPKIPEGMLAETKVVANRADKPDLRIRVFKLSNSGTEPRPGMLYIHGGGFSIGSPDEYLDLIKQFMDLEGCIIVSPYYRKSVEHPYPAAFDDCYDTLLWMKANAGELGLLPDKFIVAGHSAGGGLALSVALKARDTHEVDIAFQMPIYPILDDRMKTPSSQNNNAPVWNSWSNRHAWDRYLRGLYKHNLEIPAYAAPARATDLKGLPPTIILVGGVEVFRDEVVEFVERLRQADVPVAFRLFERCYHAFEVLEPQASISKEAWAFVFDAFSRYRKEYM
jgi:acetyl esterase/lipase